MYACAGSLSLSPRVYESMLMGPTPLRWGKRRIEMNVGERGIEEKIKLFIIIFPILHSSKRRILGRTNYNI